MDNDNGKKHPTPEELEARLRSGMRERRPNRLLLAAILLLLLGGPVALWVWWFWPPPPPPALSIVAVDALAAADRASVELAALLEPKAGTDEEISLGGLPVVLQEAPGPPTPDPWRVPVDSGQDGWCTADRPISGVGNAVTMFTARYVAGEATNHAQDAGNLYVYPPATPLLVVDVTGTITPGDSGAWGADGVPTVVQDEGAVAALHAVAGVGKKARVVYFATGAESGRAYRAMRGWLRLRGAKSKVAYPAGPVLWKLPGESREGGFVAAHLRSLQQQFPRLTGLTRDPATAATFVAAGVRTLVVGEGDWPEGAVRVNGWEGVADALDQAE